MKIFIAIFILIVELSAMNQNASIVGQWLSVRQTKNQGTLTIEKEYLNLNGNNTFNLLLLVSVEKGNAFVKDLQIKVSGIWKVNKDVLVYVIQSIDVPMAREVYRISQDSLTQLANYFRHRFDSQSIRILMVQSMNAKSLNVISENGLVTNYTR